MNASLFQKNPNHAQGPPRQSPVSRGDRGLLGRGVRPARTGPGAAPFRCESGDLSPEARRSAPELALLVRTRMPYSARSSVQVRHLRQGSISHATDACATDVQAVGGRWQGPYHYIAKGTGIAAPLLSGWLLGGAFAWFFDPPDADSVVVSAVRAALFCCAASSPEQGPLQSRSDRRHRRALVVGSIASDGCRAALQETL